MLTVRGSEITLIAAYNWGRPDEEHLALRATAYVKSCSARSADGLLTNQKERADACCRPRGRVVDAPRTCPGHVP